MSCIAFIHSIVESGDCQMIYTMTISLLIEKLFYLLRPHSFSFQSVRVYTDTFIDTSSQWWGF